MDNNFNLKRLLHNIFTKQNNSSCKQATVERFAAQYNLSEDSLNTLLQCVANLEKKGFDLLDGENGLLVSNGKINFKIDANILIAQEVFCDELYQIPPSLLDERKNYCIFDIGANKGYSALYFAEKKWVKRIDAFEIMPRTFNFALENFALNKDLKKKINIYKYGLGNDTREIEAFFVPDRDDISTVNQKWLQSRYPDIAAAAQPVKVQLVQASFCLKDLMEHREISNIILKIDANGAEQEILQDLADNFPKIFEEIKIITGKTYSKPDTLLKIIAPFNYKLVNAQPRKNGCTSFLLYNQNSNN